ncbi:MAG: LysM peptidoglycan-binding domain-containing protein [Syntrophales bacterium]
MRKRTLLCVGLVLFFVSVCFPNQSPAEIRYRVKSGDTVSRIARKYGISTNELREANGIKGNSIRARQVLIIPERGAKKISRRNKATPQETVTYRVKKGDSIYTIAFNADCSAKQIRKMNHLKSNKLRTGQRLIIPRAKVRTEEAMEEDQDIEADADARYADLPPDEPQEKPESIEIGKWNGPEERKLFVRVVKTFLGVPYRYGGSTLRGLDCSSFVRKVYEIFDIFLPRTAREQSRSGKWVKKEELEEGDLVFFRTRRANDHVGIYIGNNEFIHLSSKNREAKVDNLDEPYFQQRFIRGVRVKELKITPTHAGL